MIKISRANLAYYKENIEKANFSIKIEHANLLYHNLIDAQKKYSLYGRRKQIKIVPHEISAYSLTFSPKPLSTDRKITLCTQQVAQC